jgi:hypothetical protein
MTLASSTLEMWRSLARAAIWGKPLDSAKAGSERNQGTARPAWGQDHAPVKTAGRNAYQGRDKRIMLVMA